MSREVVILSAARTPVGRYLGALAEVPASQLGAIAMVEALKRAGVDPAQVEEVIMGNVLQAGQGQNPARKASLIAGIPQDVKGQAFAKIYDGSDDPAEIRAGYEKLFGPLEQKPEGTAGAELSAEQRIAAAGSAGASQGTPGTIDIGEAIKGAKTNAEVLEIIRQHGHAAGLSLPADS